MIFRLLARMFFISAPEKDPSATRFKDKNVQEAAKIVDSYTLVLETAAMVAGVDVLSYPKDQIKEAIIKTLRSTEDALGFGGADNGQLIDHLKACYIGLSKFQEGFTPEIKEDLEKYRFFVERAALEEIQRMEELGRLGFGSEMARTSDAPMAPPV
ncbi:MAG: hypothetical protein ACTSXQ_07865 [Alphaproteobacteria bacterium]